MGLSFYPEQWGNRHSSHDYPEVPNSDWPIGSCQCGYVVIYHLIFRLILISPQSLWTTVVPLTSFIVYVFMCIRVGQRKSRDWERELGTLELELQVVG